MKLKDIPNTITILRLLLVLPICYYLLTGRGHVALIIFIIAGLSDGIDGYLARRFGWRSRFGSIFDPLVDKCLLVATFFCLMLLGDLPLWLFLLTFARDGLIVAAFTRDYARDIRYEITPIWVSKLNTALQIILAVCMLSNRGVLTIPESFLIGLIAGVVVTTISSFGCYAWLWRRQRSLVATKMMESS